MPGFSLSVGSTCELDRRREFTRDQCSHSFAPFRDHMTSEGGTMRRKVWSLLPVLLLGIVLATCGGDDTGTAAPNPTAVPPEAESSVAVGGDCSDYADREIASLEVAADGRYKYVGKITDPLKLDAGVRYTICTYGTVKIAKAEDAVADAEYGYINDPPGSLRDKCGTSGSEVEIGLRMTGVTIIDPEAPLWGEYRPDHVYTATVEGTGEAISFVYRDCADGSVTSGNHGSLSVVIAETGP